MNEEAQAVVYAGERAFSVNLIKVRHIPVRHFLVRSSVWYVPVRSSLRHVPVHSSVRHVPVRFFRTTRPCSFFRTTRPCTFLPFYVDMYGTQCCGSEMFIPDPGSEFFHPGSRVKNIPESGSWFSDPHQRTKVFLTQPTVSKLSEI